MHVTSTPDGEKGKKKPRYEGSNLGLRGTIPLILQGRGMLATTPYRMEADSRYLQVEVQPKLQTGSSEFTIEPLTTSAPPTRLSAMSSTEETTIPPEGYYVTDCPNLAENNTLSCPYIGCDGFVFRSAEEC
ncbi:hypothetical protein CDV31_004992 [Fusarium ambrosium]|uniref:Uncharacterized protein n=1 Tax=Fusarium ambrosium TaxID=131363 RepID=A0A428UMG1_9HYPO|nr:hypothetical protein CDV31_004992 [Fusarium ambrosium]